MIDFADTQQFRRVLALVERADIVIESSRPRALQQLGVDRERFVARGGVWVGITGHDDLDRVGFGDDAAVAGGLAAIMARGWGTPLFAGDAISDPLTGIYAALAAATYWREGRSGLIRLSLARSLAYAAGEHVANGGELEEWQRLADNDAAEHYPLRIAAGRSARLGTDNHLLD